MEIFLGLFTIYAVCYLIYRFINFLLKPLKKPLISLFPKYESKINEILESPADTFFCAILKLIMIVSFIAFAFVILFYVFIIIGNILYKMGVIPVLSEWGI
jgi:hypothetical protein